MSSEPKSYVAKARGSVMKQSSQAEQSRLSQIWTKHSKAPEMGVPYKKTVVLMISWEDHDMKGLYEEVSFGIAKIQSKADQIIIR
jgi:hypothetical protein